MKNYIFFTLGLAFIAFNSFAQNELKTKHFEEYTTYFKLSDNHEIPTKIRSKFKEELKNVQFVGLAEIHQSQQLSFFTKGLLGLLSESCFNHFALELGPNSAQILNELSDNNYDIPTKLNFLNQTYGTNDFPKVPLIFIDKKEEADFIDEAANLNYIFWGLDQEFRYSFEMHLDRIYAMTESTTIEVMDLYKKSKKIVRNTLIGDNSKGKIGCTLKDNQTIKDFFEAIKGNDKIDRYLEDILISLNIYCKQEMGNGGSQERADYMKTNFDNYYQKALSKDKFPKVLFKLGSTHLTHSFSPSGIDDIGKHISEKAKTNGTEFLSFYHLRRYNNDRDLINSDEFKDIKMILELGKKNKWALIDLRPIRERINERELTTTDIISYGLNSYDFVLLSPNDRNGILNY